MLCACLEASLGNHGIASATGIPIAHAITPITTICRIGRLRTVVSVSGALVHHSARILCILGDEWHQDERLAWRARVPGMRRGCCDVPTALGGQGLVDYD